MSLAAATGAVPARAAVLLGGSRVRTIETRIVEPRPNEIRVRVEGCGVCASNLPVWEGRSWFTYPTAPGAPGHEGWGTVDAVGEEAGDFTEGERVAFLSQNAYAEYDIAPAGGVVRLPPALGARPFPGEPLGCGMNIFRRSDIRAGHTVAIVGVGFLGAMLTALATAAGARVIAFSRRAFALGVAERFGATHCIALGDPQRAVREFERVHGGGGCERVIEAAGTQEALDVASALAGTRARLVIAGYHQDGPRRVDLQQWNWRGLDVVNAHERDPREYVRGMQQAIDLVAGGGFDPQPLLTHTFSLAGISHAFEALATRPHGFMKAWVSCT